MLLIPMAVNFVLGKFDRVHNTD